ncbi:hypothetical protein QFZ82_000339 [Streptomyces sp. V4I23]|uniref:hypothetical protein n=1 Tax=Streptomyces sp. V4I23 TaxID=3042282 RepID=UPI00278A244F|nr:hypothetical protein [Streptomyces sp. V4I23]MDQ1005854.1 hypothetical protein [Streptomyces sp. V4I23]
MRTFRQTVLADVEPGAVAVHDRYQTYDSTQLGGLNHQLCLATCCATSPQRPSSTPTTPGPSSSPTNCAS